jgi:hypothetical protein
LKISVEYITINLYLHSVRSEENMRFLSTQALLSLTLVCTVTSLTAAPGIGLATASGSFRVNSSQVWGNTTLLDGATIETAKAASQVKLNNGVQMRLGADSRAKIYEGHLVLEKGASQLEASSAYPVEASTLRISSEAPNTVARVQLTDRNRVMVAAVQGAVRVTNAAGLLIANLEAGRAANFDPQAGAAGPTQVSGCLTRQHGKFIVVDETTHVAMQVQGSGLEKEVGNKVQITGAVDSAKPTVPGASQLINVQSLKQVAKGGCTAGGAAAGAAAAGAGAAGAGAGMATGTTVAIIGGVAVAGTVGGLAAAGTFSGRSSQPSTSR